MFFFWPSSERYASETAYLSTSVSLKFDVLLLSTHGFQVSRERLDRVWAALSVQFASFDSGI